MIDVETVHDVLLALAGRYAFGEVAALLAAGAGAPALSTPDAAQAQQLCAFGQRLLDTDAEDFGATDATHGANTDTSIADRVSGDAVPGPLARRARASRMPQFPDERLRGALESLVPAYRLLLEVIAVRWARRETTAVVAALHLASEYAPLLAWEPILGHAGDPPRLVSFVSVAGSRFGTSTGDDCAHRNADASAARRLLHLGRAADGTGDVAQWRGYLDRQHSHIAHALAVCAAQCRHQCTVVRQLSDVDGEALRNRCALALAYADSPIVRLRHSTPVGHGLGVPSLREVAAAWARSRERLGGAALHDDGYPLPGLPSFFAALAGVELTPDTLLADTVRALAEVLTGAPGAETAKGNG